MSESDAQNDPKVAELLDRIKSSLDHVKDAVLVTSRTLAYAHCNQIEQDLEEIRAILTLENRDRELPDPPSQDQ